MTECSRLSGKPRKAMGEDGTERSSRPGTSDMAQVLQRETPVCRTMEEAEDAAGTAGMAWPKSADMTQKTELGRIADMAAGVVAVTEVATAGMST